MKIFANVSYPFRLHHNDFSNMATFCQWQLIVYSGISWQSYQSADEQWRMSFKSLSWMMKFWIFWNTSNGFRWRMRWQKLKLERILTILTISTINKWPSFWIGLIWWLEFWRSLEFWPYSLTKTKFSERYIRPIFFV